MVKEHLISKEEAIERIKGEDIERLFYPILDPDLSRTDLAETRLASGVNAVPGAAVGQAVFSAHEAESMAAGGNKVILVRRETSPEDVGGMAVAQGILTATGGKTSHAAVVARGWGKCCVVGCEALEIDYSKKLFRANGRVIHQGEWITIDGNEGAVYQGQLKLTTPQLPPDYETLLSWCDSLPPASDVILLT
jgi:pyruvate,orthophosphate dikinase